MPFTLTHTLAIMPAAQRWKKLPAAALCIGAMVPDWSLFVPFGPHYSTMHTFSGIFSACIPLGVLLFILFRCLYRRAMIELLPTAVQSRLESFKHWQTAFGARELLLAAVAVGIGSATHLLWDAFTHAGRWGVEAVPLLSSVIFSIGSSDIHGYKLFQHGSSVVGLPLLLLFAWRWLGRQTASGGYQPLLNTSTRCLLLLLLVGAPFVAVTAKITLALQPPLSPELIGNALVVLVTQLGLLSFQLFNLYCIGLVLLAGLNRDSGSDIEASPG